MSAIRWNIYTKFPFVKYGKGDYVVEMSVSNNIE